MASNDLAVAEEQWRMQFAAMQKALAELNLTSSEPSANLYDEYDEDDDDTITSSSPRGEGYDVWDFISDDDDDNGLDDSCSSSGSGVVDADASLGHGTDWFSARCSALANKNGLAPDVLQTQVVGVLTSGASDDELQAQLADLIGFDDLDFVIQVLSRKDQIAAAASASPGPANGQPRLLNKAQRQEALYRQDAQHKNAALLPSYSKEPQYPHVYRAYTAGNSLSATGKKYGLPAGSERLQFEKYEEYFIPAGKKGTLGAKEKLVRIADLDGLCRRTFKGYKSLNRMQSLVYPVAYKSSENMLICAPTGAGKTDAAMLTILHTIGQYTVPKPGEEVGAVDFAVNVQEFKIVYVAPMKALAAEVTEKLGKRLAWLGIKCREYTGDMQLTKSEIVQTQIIVTTPEKWDVVTRKGTGDTELVQKVRLLIIDEVHMLHDERGAVLESLVARTQRQVESTQSLIRIIGLSATLPNYVDVADFLRVNRYAGLFYFDASFRPVPLEQHFIGVKGKTGSKQCKENLDTVAFEKVKQMLEREHQVMVFVHSRKDTMASAKMLDQKAMEQMCSSLFDPSGHPKYEQAARDMKTSRSKEIRQLLAKGLGIHHAGMARADRNLMERLFGEGVIKVLCCTATLAWGVNLPAAAVVIKGTQVYSAQEGKFVDLGILDVLQIFGRAGRPQFEDTGIGMICTSQDRLQHYLRAVTEQQPIESRFSAKLVDNVNAEIALGTVTSIADAVQWIGYSYLFVRMQRSPTTYGIEWAEIRDDPELVQRRRQLAEQAARTLQQCQMIVWNERSDELRSKDIGRIASQYYILHTSIQIFNSMMRPQATEADVFKMLSMSGEFDNVQSRDNEAKELMRLRHDVVPCDVAGGIDTPQCKTNLLLQAYVSRQQLDDFALSNDMNYVAQQSGRICRALFMLALNRRWGHQCLVLLTLCKSIERRIWPFEHPLHQFELAKPILNQLDAREGLTVEAMRDMEPAEIGALVHNHGAGIKIAKLLHHFPTVHVEADMAPLNRDVLRIKLHLSADFGWRDQIHGASESFWIWVENSDTGDIYHYEFWILSRRKLHDAHELNFCIPLADPLPTQIYVRAVSDRWLGAETVTAVSFQHLIRPDTESVYTELLKLQPLPIGALQNAQLEEVYAPRFGFFNPMQTQIFHTLYHTPANVLLGSPTGSGKTVAAELAMWWAFRERPGSKVVYIAPMKALVRERVKDWGERLARPLGLRLVELTGDQTPDRRSIEEADIMVTTPEKWDGISRAWQSRGYVRQVSLVIIDEIHLLAGDRGPILEIIVSRMNFIASTTKQAVRLVGMSTAVANASDLANWLGVKHGLFNFRHSVRPVPLELYIDGFPETRGFCPLMQSMNRPTFVAIKKHSPSKPVIVFVASRRQTRLTAKDLINFCAIEDNPRRFVAMDEDELQLHLVRAKDDALKEALSFGIGLHHAGLVESDRQLAEELFVANKIQILVATSTLAWGVNLPAHLVVVKGTQFYDAKTEAYKDMDLTDVLQMLGRAGRPQFDTSGVARIFTQDAKKDFYKHFLHTGFPVESLLHTVLANHLCAEIAAQTIATKQDALDYLTWTFFFRRLLKNPCYYGLELTAEEHGSAAAAQQAANDYMVELVDEAVRELVLSGCVEEWCPGELGATPLGQVVSFYYLDHKTVRSLVARARTHKRREDDEVVVAFGDVVASVCLAAEYDELPVRHNEEAINAALADALPLPTSLMSCNSASTRTTMTKEKEEEEEDATTTTTTTTDLPLWDAHVKAFLLLQAHFSRVELPISDYVGDQTSVLDQAVRIVQAAIDVFAELGLSEACVQAVRLLQSVKSASWPSDAPLSILPGVGPFSSFSTSSPSFSTSSSSSPQEQLPTLAQVAAMAPAQVSQLAARLDVPRAQQASFFRAASHLPDVAVEVKPQAPAQGQEPAQGQAQGPAVRINLVRHNGFASAEGRMWAPRFPKVQTEGWVVVVIGRGEVVGVKRMGWRLDAREEENGRREGKNGRRGGAGEKGEKKARQEEKNGRRGGAGEKRGGGHRASTVIKLPEGVQEVDVLVMSDGYPKLEHCVRGVQIPAPTTTTTTATTTTTNAAADFKEEKVARV